MLVSIAIPTFGHHKYIAESINSILNQTYDNIEVIIVPVVNDKKTFSEIQKIHDKRIRVVPSNYALITHQMNLGVYAAKGDWFMFFASDDILLKNSVKNLLDFAVENSCIMVYPDFYIYNEKTKKRIIKTNPDFDINISQEKSSYMTDVSLIKREELIKCMPMRFLDGKARIRRVWNKISQDRLYIDKIKRYPYPTFIYRIHKKSVHLHGSQKSYRVVSVGESAMDYDVKIKKLDRKKISFRDFCIYTQDPNCVISNYKDFMYKKVIIHWNRNTIPLSDNEIVSNFYHIASDLDVYDTLVNKGFKFVRRIYDMTELVNYISEDSINDIITEIA